MPSRQASAAELELARQLPPALNYSGKREPSPGTHLAEIQRSRLLAATVSVVEQYGYSDVTVTHITHRARISRRTFYELFKNREECLAAMLEHALELISAEIASTPLDGLPWRGRVRGGLEAILCFFDREPALARVCVVQTLRGEESVLARREEVLTGLARVVEEGRNEGARAKSLPPLTAEGLVGAAHAIVYARLLKKDQGPLTELLGDLMGMIVLPYLGPEASRREQDQPAPAPQTAPTNAPHPASDSGRIDSNPLEGIPMRVTYRTALVLQHIAERPGISNREVAGLAGISDQGQMSKLLTRLQRLGLIFNTGEGHTKGEPNAWTLTPTGWQVARSIPVPIRGHVAVA